jgi:DNA-directed RNA polymerase beta subunit
VVTGGQCHNLTRVITQALGSNFLSSTARTENGLFKYRLIDNLGRWAGWVAHVKGCINTIVSLRRNLQIHPFVSYHVCSSTQVIQIRLIPGQIVRPLLILENIDETLRLVRRFKSSGNLTTELLANQCLEYVSSTEETHIAMAPDLNTALLTPEKFTHVELTGVAFVGLLATLSPFFSFNQGPRLAYWVSMCKQVTSGKIRQPTGSVSTNRLWYGQRPLVSTAASKFLNMDLDPSVLNCTLIIFPLSYNQEDAIVVKKSSLDRGMFTSDSHKVYEASVNLKGHRRNSEVFENPLHTAKDPSRLLAYEKLDPNGLPRKGVRLQSGDIVIGRTIPTNTKTNHHNTKSISQFNHTASDQQRKDSSLLIHSDDTGCVDEAIKVDTPQQTHATVNVRSVRIPEVGDKFSSRHSQKGTIGRIEEDVNLPFSCQTGLIPDIVMSPLGFSRMTMGKIMELLCGKAVALTGEFLDELADNQILDEPADTQLEFIQEILVRNGFQANGKEQFCDGVTGEMIEGTVLTGFVSYCRLNHLVSKKCHARSTGPRHILTHQPNEGRCVNGGLRFGPMEVECTVAHSASELLRERTLTVSDEFKAYVCDECGFIADGNAEVGYFFCRYCQSTDNIYTVFLPYTSKLMLQELNATGIRLKLQLGER